MDVRRKLTGNDLDFYSLEAAEAAGAGDVGRLPMTVKVLLEMLLRDADEGGASDTSIQALARWPQQPPPGAERSQ